MKYYMYKVIPPGRRSPPTDRDANGPGTACRARAWHVLS
jgi:hypothetical protein